MSKKPTFRWPELPPVSLSSVIPTRPRPTTKEGRKARYTDCERAQIALATAERLNELKRLGLAQPGHKWTPKEARELALKYGFGGEERKKDNG